MSVSGRSPEEIAELNRQLYIAEFGGQRRRITASSFYSGELGTDPRYAAPYSREDFYKDTSPNAVAPPRKR